MVDEKILQSLILIFIAVLLILLYFLIPFSETMFASMILTDLTLLIILVNILIYIMSKGDKNENNK
jgi:hypothetical protein